MNKLHAAGLSDTEAKTYESLLSRAAWQPSELAKTVGESRTNMYKILDKLVSLGLAKKFDQDKKIHYAAVNPGRLLELAHARRQAQEQAEKELQVHSQQLIRSYVKTHEQPAITYYQGKDEMREIFDVIENANEEIVFVHTVAGIDFYGFDFMHQLRMRAVKSGRTRRGLTPDTALATVDYKEKDALVNLTRTWLKAEDYTAPVEWGAFDDKLYIISYGEDALGMVIQNQQIADAFKQLFALLERGQHALPDYGSLPLLASRKGRTD